MGNMYKDVLQLALAEGRLTFLQVVHGAHEIPPVIVINMPNKNNWVWNDYSWEHPTVIHLTLLIK